MNFLLKSKMLNSFKRYGNACSCVKYLPYSQTQLNTGDLAITSIQLNRRE